jgi:small conductance mechanosensitive channel
MGIELFGMDIEDKMPLIGLSVWDFIVFALVLVVGIIVVKIIGWVVEDSFRRSKVDQIVIGIAGSLTRGVGYIAVLAFALAFLGPVGAMMTGALLGFSVVLGLILGFTLGDTLSNLAAGFMIAFNKPFKVGDWVEANGQGGEIKKVGVIATEMDTPDNKRVIIPNKLVWNSNIVNYTRHDKRRIDMEVGVSYGTDLDKVKRVTMKLLTSHPKVLNDPAPQVEVKDMADSAVILVVRPWVRTEDYWNTFWELKKAIKQRYDQTGIAIPFPQVDVHMANKR